jgi:hypothetical protein
VVDPDALTDLAEAQDWYDERQEGIGQELHDEVATALSRIRSDPGIGARYRDTAFRFYNLGRRHCSRKAPAELLAQAKAVKFRIDLQNGRFRQGP